MKKLTLLITTLLIAYMVSAQSPEKFSYQAVIRDGDGFLITESTIGMKVSILQDVTPVYVETHNPLTDQNGMVYVEIGTGTTTDDFSAIDWANGIFFLKIETDILGGTNYSLVSTTQILSVPYALHAKSAETVTGTISENDPIYNGSAASGISSGDVVNWDESYSWGNHADAGYLQSFTEAQILTISNDTIYLTGGSYVKLPEGFSGDWEDLSNVPANLTTIINNNFEGDYSDLTNVPTNVSAFTNDAGYITNPDDADADPTNELQIISMSNDTIYLSDGGNVKLPEGFSGDYVDLTNVPSNVSVFTNDAGYITNPNDADSDPTNELQIISISNDTIYLSNGGNVKLPEGFSGDYADLTNVPTTVSAFTNDVGYITNPNDADADPANELQSLSISNDTVYLSNGGFVELPAAANGENGLSAYEIWLGLGNTGSEIDFISSLTGPQGSVGNDGKGISNTVDNGNGTFTLFYTDGSSFTTSDLTGQQGPIGPAGTYTAGDGIIINSNEISVDVSAFPNSSQDMRIGFSSSSTWTCPEGVTEITVEVWGGAGGGGGSSVSGSVSYYNAWGNQACSSFGCYNSTQNKFTSGAGGKGGKGGYNKQIINVTPGQVYTITIGNGGIGGAGASISYNAVNKTYPVVIALAGQAGNATSFHGLVQASGGAGGSPGLATNGYCTNSNASCTNGSNGSNSAVTNHGGSILLSNNSQPRSFIPIGYILEEIEVGCCSNGGNGGSAVSTNEYSLGQGNTGSTGEKGYCVISY